VCSNFSKKRSRATANSASGSDSDPPPEGGSPRSRGKKKKLKKKVAEPEDGLSAKQRSRVVSKAVISTSEEDSDNQNLRIASEE
jgi:RNA polymerase-associated protein CTR9